ncbi:siderophore-interacting protein [Lentzea sp. NPDC060358]|uniref:siderophore-interacting protein n=1 Tax=Lentzea sp. NPDC060358 TaxID=3347103 RepID=UPI00364C9F92
MISTSPGRLTSLLLDLSTREAEVSRADDLGPRFRLVSIAGDSLKGVAWSPGDMVQVVVVGAALLGPWEVRSYTPLAFDPATGTAEVLWYVHGGGPGSGWAASATAGTPCRLVGPRRAVPLRTSRRPLVFFGDETSFGTAVALRATPSGDGDVRFVFEVDSVEESRAVLARFGLTDAALVARDAGDSHLDEVEHEVLTAYRSAGAGVLTGKASSIQRLYRALRAAGARGRDITNVPYWAPGKKGLKGH